MLSKIKELSKNKVIENFFHIGIIKFVNIFSKYVLISYLIRTLGEINYGTLTWIESFIQYFIVYINFGFDIFIVKKIIENKDNKKEIDTIITTVIGLKLILFTTSFLILTILLFFFNIKQFNFLFYLMLLMGLGEVFFPLWYFQGIQRMKFLSLTSVLSKGFLIFATILLVKKQSHLLLYITLLVISNFLYGGLGFYFLYKNSNFQFVRVDIKNITTYFKDGFLFYLGRTSTLFMNFGTIFLIGEFFSKSLVSGFDLSSKIIFVFVFVFEVVQQSFFPSIFASQDKKKLGKLVFSVLILGVFFNLIVYFFSSEFLILLGGNDMKKYHVLLKQLSVLIPIIGVTTILGSCGLVAFGGIKKFNYSFLISALLYVLSVIVLKYLSLLTFQNLVLVRIFVDVLMVILIIIFSIQLNLFNYINLKKIITFVTNSKNSKN